MKLKALKYILLKLCQRVCLGEIGLSVNPLKEQLYPTAKLSKEPSWHPVVFSQWVRSRRIRTLFLKPRAGERFRFSYNFYRSANCKENILCYLYNKFNRKY